MSTDGLRQGSQFGMALTNLFDAKSALKHLQRVGAACAIR
jgi:hypothetical protein